jgi:hypothetical protein
MIYPLEANVFEYVSTHNTNSLSAFLPVRLVVTSRLRNYINSYRLRKITERSVGFWSTRLNKEQAGALRTRDIGFQN